MTVLLSSDHEQIYSDIRSQLMNVVNMEQVIDVFSYSMYFDKEIYSEPKYLKDTRYAALEVAAREIYHNHVYRAIAECGVYRGNFSCMMSRLMPDRKLYLFDTFEGFDEKDNTGVSDENFAFNSALDSFDFRNTSVQLVLNKIGSYIDTVVRKGYFPETAKGLEEETFDFVSLDTDIYKPILSGLEFFWPRLSRGGYIFIHDFASLPGVRRAVFEFCQRTHIGYVRLPDINHSIVLSKPL